ncbi:MAG: NAD(P)/FAD-dependent oxidoreductase [Candidatus Paceibacterota bacterium]|jgi:hypothetical protein
MQDNEETIWDVAVIGGGPAGMMSAGRSAELGAKVILIEKNDTLGKKLLITGGGRCNVTNAEYDNRKLLERFKDDGKFLFSAFSQWSVKETLDFFHNHKMETKIENEQRVFPLSNKAESVWNIMVEYIKSNGVTVLSNSPVTGVSRGEASGKASGTEKPWIINISGSEASVIRAKSVIIATGGTSHPETGSTGDAYAWLAKIGHKIIEPTPSLVPLAVKDSWVKKLAGVSLTNIRLTPFQNGVKQSAKISATKKGLAKSTQKILFTHVGISGPTVLNMSRDIGELLKYSEVIISLDLLPDFDYAKLNEKLQEIFKENDKKKFKNSLDKLIPSAMVPVITELSKIDSEINCNSVSREERLRLVTLLKDIPMHIDKLLGVEKAIISSGGVSLEEVDFKTMRSRISPNIFLVGDILNIDRPSGGYSLQICWTTGFVAGTNAVQKSPTLLQG